MSDSKRTVLITGCSEGGLGAGLALAFHKQGLRVFATARDPSKMVGLKSLNIETVTLDVLSDSSIESCVTEISNLTGGTLDILINNAGGGYNMPVADVDIGKAKQLFELNVWSYLSITQTFLPLLLSSSKSTGSALIVNNTSISSIAPTPHSSVYHASKAAAAMFSDHERIELAPFGIKVIDLKTGCVKSNFHSNRSDDSTLPADSIYAPVREETERAMRAEHFSARQDLTEWADQVVGDLLKKNPPARVWRGTEALTTWLEATFAPTVTWFDAAYGRMVGLDLLAQRLKSEGRV